jgi:hypothetical protein
MSIFEQNDYRTILKRKVKDTAPGGKRLTWKKIAARVPVQYTYLSRALNHPGTHLSEDHLHEVLKILNFFPDELEYVLALRGLETATSESRKEHLQKKLFSLRSSRELNAPAVKGSPVSGEVNFLLSPLAWIVYFALGIPEFRENPRRIAQRLALEPAQLKKILHNLHDLGLIEIDANIFQVLKINKNHFHYGFDHPLTHLHQQMLRLLCDSHYLRLPEDKRHRFMVTFNADAPAVAKVEELFRGFIRDVEKAVRPAPNKATYQLNFELFPWT